MASQQTTRRNLVKGAAWVAPAIVIAAPAPAMALSGKCVPPDLAWSKWTNLTPSVSSTCVSTVAGADGMWWLYCDGGTTTDLVYTRQICFPVTPGRTYTFSFSTMANQGLGSSRSPATLAVSLGGTLKWFGYTQSSANPPGSTVSHALKPGYILENWSFTYLAPAGTTNVCLTYTWTAFKKGSLGAATDDIGATAPKVTCA